MEVSMGETIMGLPELVWNLLFATGIQRNPNEFIAYMELSCVCSLPRAFVIVQLFCW